VVATKRSSAPPRALADDRTQAGDRAQADSTDDLIRANFAYLSRLAYRLLGRDEDVDDVLQDVFLAFLRWHGKLRDPKAARGWLATVTVRMSHRRLRSRRLRALVSLEAQPEPHAPGATPEDHAALSRIHRALQAVPVPAQVAWVLRYLEEERLEDVARLCRCSLATAKRRISVAHRAVQAGLDAD
jgi:RNA polymerase sigma-70 factor (ECF subfamily)